MYKIYQFYKECSTSLLGLHSAGYSEMWLYLEFHYASKDIPNDIASQVKVDVSMTEIFPLQARRETKLLNAWAIKGKPQSEKK